MSVAELTPSTNGNGRPQLADQGLIKEQCYIDGVWVGAPSVSVTNPATGEEIGTVPNLGGGEIGHITGTKYYL